MFLHLSPFLQGGRRGFLRQGVFTRRLASTEDGALPKRKQATIIAVPALRASVLRQCCRTRVVLRPLFLSITPHWASLPSRFVNLKTRLLSLSTNRSLRYNSFGDP